jgi:hypothetical protein
MKELVKLDYQYKRRRVAELLGLRVEAVREMPETGTLVKKNYKNNKWKKKLKY